MQEKKPLTQPENLVYRRIKLLGQGTYGKVYLVECLSTHTLCVLKQIDIKDQTEEEKKKALKEAKILEALKHPNIINFREVYKTKKGRLCIVMDYADGGDLAQRIEKAKKENKNFSENQILDWFTQICLALKHVHDRKIIHRDLKSSNIFLTKENNIKLGDFGIAIELSYTLEKVSSSAGTPYYLSPEIFDNKPYNNKTDMWSLGVILYEMCALQYPFNANSLVHLALNIVRGIYKDLSYEYSKELKNLVAILLSTDPSKRPSINEVLKMPIITNRIKHFLSESIRKIEFSHTILHNNQNNLPNQKKNQNLAKHPIPIGKKNIVTNNQIKKQIEKPSPVPVEKTPIPQVEKKQISSNNPPSQKKDQKLKKVVSAQEKKDEEERKKKIVKDKERDEERNLMKKDIEKKRYISQGGKNLDDKFKIEWMGQIKPEDSEKIEESDTTTSSKQTKIEKEEIKINIIEKNDKKTEKKIEIDKKTRLTREELQKMKKNVNKDKDFPIEIYLPPQRNQSPKKDVPCVQIELENQNKLENENLLQNQKILDQDTENNKFQEFFIKETKIDPFEQNEQLNTHNNNEKKQKSETNINFFENLEKEIFDNEIKSDDGYMNKERLIFEKTEPKLEDDKDLENIIEELQELIIGGNDLKNQEKKVLKQDEIKKEYEKIEEIKKNIDWQEDREDDPNDFEEFNQNEQNDNKIPPSLEESQCISILAENNKSSKLYSLRSLLKDVLGIDNFDNSYRIIKKEMEKRDLDEIDRIYGDDNYKGLFPFLKEELIIKYLPILFTYVIMESK